MKFLSLSLSLSPSEHGKLAEMISELSTGLAGVKHEQEYMEVRERIHRMSEDHKVKIFALNFSPSLPSSLHVS